MITMVMSNKILSRGTQLAQTSDMKKEKKKETINIYINDLKQAQRQIHNLMKYQNRSHLQKQSAALSR